MFWFFVGIAVTVAAYEFGIADKIKEMMNSNED